MGRHPRPLVSRPRTSLTPAAAPRRVCAPLAGTYPEHINGVKGNNGIVMYDMANCWVSNVSGWGRAGSQGLGCAGSL